MRDAQDVDVLDHKSANTAKTTEGSRFPGATSALLTIVGVVVADQATKWLAIGALEPGSCAQPGTCIDLVAGIKFRLVFNTGAAFSTGSNFGPILAILAFAMAGLVFSMAAKQTSRRSAILLGAIAGGAIGNVIDRVFRADDGLFSGAVVDFIDLGWWPVFNIADSAIVVGVLATILVTLFQRPQADEAVTA